MKKIGNESSTAFQSRASSEARLWKAVLRLPSKCSKVRKITLLIIFGILLSKFAFTQGAIDGFLKGKKETDIALTYSYENYNQYWFGDVKEDRELTTESMSFFLAHGFNKYVNLIVSVPYIWSETESSLQDAILAVKFRNKLTTYDRGQLSKISSIGFSFPLSDYDIDAENPIGEKAVTFMLRHLYQYQSNDGWFVHLQSGFDFRLVPLTKFAIPVIFRFGFAAEKFYVDGWFDILHTLNSGVNQTIVAGEGSRFLKIGGTFYYGINSHFGVFVGGAHFLTGRNIGQASRLNVGVVYKRFKNE